MTTACHGVGRTRSVLRSDPALAQALRLRKKQRGTDWVRTVFKEAITAAWLNDFAPSFTVIDNTTNNPFRQPRYAGANLSQLGQEVQTVPGRFYSITEIARSNTRTFHDRLTENLLPARGEGVSFSSRLWFDGVVAGRSSTGRLTTNDVDQAFVAYTSYNAQSGDAVTARPRFPAVFHPSGLAQVISPIPPWARISTA